MPHPLSLLPRSSVLVVAVMLTAAVARADDATTKCALLVGVTKDRHADSTRTQLRYPEADAKVGGQGTDGGVVLVGLFGHGVQYGDDAYFCPYDTTLRKVVDSQGRPLPDRNGRVKLEPDRATDCTTNRWKPH